jgi:hypothetical protein
LLSLGLKRETADMVLTEYSDGIWRPSLVFDNGEDEDGYDTSLHMEILPNDIPAWSLHRLIEMALKDLLICGISFVFNDYPYDKVIELLEFQIKCGRFPKEYLV